MQFLYDFFNYKILLPFFIAAKILPHDLQEERAGIHNEESNHTPIYIPLPPSDKT